jgi:hypothetical protein
MKCLFSGVADILMEMFNPIRQQPMTKPNLSVFDKWDANDQTVEEFQITLAQPLSEAVKGVS